MARGLNVFGAALAGAVSGYGGSLRRTGQADREAYYRRKAQEREQQFQMQRDDIQHSRQVAENERNRAHRSAENALNRQATAASRQNFMTEAGTNNLISVGANNKATTVTGQDGKPVRTAQGGGKTAWDRQFRILTQDMGYSQKQAMDYLNGQKPMSQQDKRTMARREIDMLYSGSFASPKERDEAFRARLKEIEALDGGRGGRNAATQQTSDTSTQRVTVESQIKRRYPNARKGPDGQWYVEQDGQMYRIRAE